MHRSCRWLMLLLAPACLNPDTVNAKSVADIRSRAAFEMHCDAQALKFTPLAESKNSPGFVEQYGVEGCGQRVVYVEIAGGWVANTHANESK